MNASVHPMPIPEHLASQEKPHLMGKEVSVKYGRLTYRFFIGDREGRLVLRVHLRKFRSRTRVIDWYDPIQVSRIPEKVAEFARSWFDKAVSAPPPSPDFFDALRMPGTQSDTSDMPFVASA